MDIDFALVLVISVALSGLIWLADALFLLPRRQAALAAVSAQIEGEVDASVRNKLTAEPVVVEYAKSFFPVLAVVLVLRSFLVEPFQIPSGSMLPTLKIGDFILVSKYSYGIRLPVINTKVISIDDPQRGDVVVFKYPNNPRVNYIKRLVGLPGDRIRYDNKTLIINGKVMPQSLIAQLPPLSPKRELLVENLGGVEHEIYKDLKRPSAAAEWVVPEGHYFMVGDNRDNSNDSRFWGFVPDELIVGKAFAVWMHWENWLSLPSFSNNGLIH